MATQVAATNAEIAWKNSHHAGPSAIVLQERWKEVRGKSWMLKPRTERNADSSLCSE